MIKHLRKTLCLLILSHCFCIMENISYSQTPENLLQRLPRLPKAAWQMVFKSIEEQRQERTKTKRKYIKTLSSKMNQKISIIGQINTKSKNYLLDNRRIPVKNLKYHGYSHIF